MANNSFKCVLFGLLYLLLSGCSAVDMKKYAANQPHFDMYSFFNGETKGWGVVQDRQGKLSRQFTVDIQGTINSDGSLKLHENFNWSDGEVSERTWLIRRQDPHHYTGTAEDVIGKANGTLYGNVLNWQYQLKLKVDDTIWKIKFDDWMYLVDNNILLNRATMSKFGLKVGEVTIVFQKKLPGDDYVR